MSWTQPEVQFCRNVNKWQDCVRSGEASQCAWMARILSALRSSEGASAILMVPPGSSDAEILSALAAFNDKRGLLIKAGVDLTTAITAETHLSSLQNSKRRAQSLPEQRSITSIWPLLLTAGLLFLFSAVLWGFALLMDSAENSFVRPIYIFIGAVASTTVAFVVVGISLFSLGRGCISAKCPSCCCRCRKRASLNEEDDLGAVSDQPPTKESILAFSLGPSHWRLDNALAPEGEPPQMPASPSSPEATLRPLAFPPAHLQTTALPGSWAGDGYNNQAFQVYPPGFSMNSAGFEDMSYADTAEQYYVNTAVSTPMITDISTAIWHQPEKYSFAARFSGQAGKITKEAEESQLNSGMAPKAPFFIPKSSTEAMKELVVDVPASAHDVGGELRPHMVQFFNDTMFQSKPRFLATHPGSDRSLSEKKRIKKCATKPLHRKTMWMPKEEQAVPPPSLAPPLLYRGDADTFSFVSREDTMSQGTFGTFNHFDVGQMPDESMVGILHPADFAPAPPYVMPPSFGAEWPRPVGSYPAESEPHKSAANIAHPCASTEEEP